MSRTGPAKKEKHTPNFKRTANIMHKNRNKEGVLIYDPSDYMNLDSVNTGIHLENLNTYPLLDDETVDVTVPPVFLGDQTKKWLEGLSDFDCRKLSRMTNSKGQFHAQMAVAYGKFPDVD